VPRVARNPVVVVGSGSPIQVDLQDNVVAEVLGEELTGREAPEAGDEFLEVFVEGEHVVTDASQRPDKGVEVIGNEWNLIDPTGQCDHPVLGDRLVDGDHNVEYVISEFT